MRRLYFALLLFLLSVPATAEDADRVILWDRNYDKAYLLDVIHMALRLSQKEFGKFEIVRSVPLEQGRVFADLDIGGLVNVAIAAASLEREKQHQPIYIPVDRGLLGFRVCLINNGKINFNGINVLKDFSKRNIMLGVGTHWPDKQVYESNGLRVLSSPLYQNLFEMLEKDRFDCLPRSISELDMELEQHAGQNFAAEPSLALIYPNADFVFVSKKEGRIETRLELGLNKALESGEFQSLFQKYYQGIMTKHNFYNRKLLILENNNLSQAAQKAINQYGVASFLTANSLAQ